MKLARNIFCVAFLTVLALAGSAAILGNPTGNTEPDSTSIGEGNTLLFMPDLNEPHKPHKHDVDACGLRLRPPPACPSTTFFADDFENSCGSGCDPSLWGWTNTNTGANSGLANSWYISCAENGNNPGFCGAGCGSDESLHLGSNTLGDIGAAYDAGQQTNKRIESPLINCTGQTGISLSFDYIEFGSGATDDCTLWYNDGLGWIQLSNPPKTACCGACNGFSQGLWTAYTIALPASADNNPNVQIGFNWTNDGSAGTDPSFAVDDVTLCAPLVLPIEMLSYDAAFVEEGVRVNWSTATEYNSDIFIVERSADGQVFEPVTSVGAAGYSEDVQKYTAIDPDPYDGISYYRIKEIDQDGSLTVTDMVAVEATSTLVDIRYKVSLDGLEVSLNSASDDIDEFELLLIDALGRVVRRDYTLGREQMRTTVPIRDLARGYYFVRLANEHKVYSNKIRL